MTKSHKEAIRRGLARRRARIENGGGGRPKDEINHPRHYRTNGLEAADVIEAFDCDWHTGTAIKYLLRAGKKDAEIADIKKALWYIVRRANKKLGKIIMIDEDGDVTHLSVAPEDRG